MRCLALAAALFGSSIVLSVSAVNLRISAAPPAKSAKTADLELVKLEAIEHSLQALAKQAHAPNGTVDLLSMLRKAEGELKAAGSAKEARTEVMNRVNGAMKDFQTQLMKRQLQLKKDNAADEEKKVASLSTIAKKLQDRLDRLNKLEKDVRARDKDREASEAKMNANKLKRNRKQSKEDLKTEKLLKYFSKKNKREVKKKLASWAVERKALTDAITSAKSGDAEATRKAMDRVMHAEKGDQDFLH